MISSDTVEVATTVKDLALETVRHAAQLDRLGHVVILGRNRQRDIAGGMHQLALRQQREAGERVGVLAAGKTRPSGPIAVS